MALQSPSDSKPFSRGDTVYAVVFAVFCGVAAIGLIATALFVTREATQPNAGMGGIALVIVWPIFGGLALLFSAAAIWLTPRLVKSQPNSFLGAGLCLGSPLIVVGPLFLTYFLYHFLLMAFGLLWLGLAGLALYRNLRGRWV